MVTRPEDKAFRLNFTPKVVLMRTVHDDNHDLVVRLVQERDTQEELIDIRLFDTRKTRSSGATKRGVMLTLEEFALLQDVDPLGHNR